MLHAEFVPFHVKDSFEIFFLCDFKLFLQTDRISLFSDSFGTAFICISGLKDAFKCPVYDRNLCL